MVQDALIDGYRWLTAGAERVWSLLPFALIFCLGLGGLYVAALRLFPDRAADLRQDLRERLKRSRSLIVLALLVIGLAGTLVEERKLVRSRREVVRGSSASRRPEPSLTGVVQYAPSVAIIEERTYTRTLTLPPDFLNRIGSEGVQVLSPYLSDPSDSEVLKMVDEFRRSGQNVVFTRALTRRDETPLPSDEANVQADFHAKGSGSGTQHYSVDFTANYRFHNPRPQPSHFRVTVPLPQGGGAIEGFEIRVGRDRVVEPNRQGLYAWEGDIPANGKAEAQVRYRMTGAGAFDYALGSERRRIGEFHMVATSDRLPRFGKAGVYPTGTNGTQSEWRLHDVLTSQNVALVFPRVDLQGELLDKTLMLLPAVLIFFSVGAARLRREAALKATVGYSAGLIGVGVLSAYMTPSIAMSLGLLVAFALGSLALRSGKGVILALACTAVGGAFLTVEHGALVAWIVVLLVGAGVAIRPPRRRTATP